MNDSPTTKETEENEMPDKRAFISFAVEDSNLRDFLVGQAKNKKSPFSFIDMSVKDPWDSEWKTKCRTKIRGCDGMISIITNNSPTASGQLWEMACALEENIPIRLIHGNEDRPKMPPKMLHALPSQVRPKNPKNAPR